MNILCGYHAKNQDACKWVIENCDENTNNITVKNWINACKEYLKSVNDGPVLVSTARDSGDGNLAMQKP